MAAIHFLDFDGYFPDPKEATVDGLLAIGGKLSATQLLQAYNSGIFPWYENDQPILWWSPDPRMVLFPEKFKISKSFSKILASQKFGISFNRNFEEVIHHCATVKRTGQQGTWITKEMQDAYINLFKMGKAMSIEVWQEEKLVGGLYGIDLPERKVFCGESMFSFVSNASKTAFYHLSKYALSRNYKLIDCQIYNPYLQSLGAEEIPRKEFIEILKL